MCLNLRKIMGAGTCTVGRNLTILPCASRFWTTNQILYYQDGKGGLEKIGGLTSFFPPLWLRLSQGGRSSAALSTGGQWRMGSWLLMALNPAEPLQIRPRRPLWTHNCLWGGTCSPLSYETTDTQRSCRAPPEACLVALWKNEPLCLHCSLYEIRWL